MAINFPNSPSPNEIYSYNNLSWLWNGAYWEVYPTTGGGISGNFVHISGDTMTGQLVAPSISATTFYLGLDLSGNTRTITADNIILSGDTLYGGSY